MIERDRKIQMAQHMWGGFYRCPTTGRIREALQGDDKVLCNCGVSNSLVPAESTEQTGVHIIKFLTPATVEEYVDEVLAQKNVNHMNQICHTLKPQAFADQINEILKREKSWRFTTIHSVPVSKIGGMDYEYFAVFEEIS